MKVPLFAKQREAITRALGQHNIPGLRWLLEGFNYYDIQRVKEVGPDRAAAEWIVRCQGSVKFDKIDDVFNDYNALIKRTAELDPRRSSDDVRIQSILAVDASVTGFGCRHFGKQEQQQQQQQHKQQHKQQHQQQQQLQQQQQQLSENLSKIHDVHFVRCKNLHDFGLEYLAQSVGGHLKELEIKSCPRITEFGLAHLTSCSALSSLQLSDLKSVHKPDVILNKLKQSLPNAQIEFK